MRNICLYLITLLLGLSLEGCKTSKHLVAVSTEDFRQLKKYAYEEYGAVILNENINVYEVGLPGLPWNRLEIVNYYSPDSAWKTEIEDKILFLKDNINGETFSVIDYVNPREMRWDLMRKCEMWIYSQGENGNIHKRKIKKREIVHERLNDSICRVRLNIQENVAGKVLVRKYYLLSPYNSVVPYYGIITAEHVHNLGMFAEVNPWTFQRDIPLLNGKFKIYLPHGDGEVTKIGNGEINFKREKTKESIAIFYVPGTTQSLSGRTMYVEHRSGMIQRKADLVTATVSNIMPLPKGSNAKPLGIKITYP